MYYLDVVTINDFTGNFSIEYEGIENKNFIDYIKHRQWYYLVLLLGNELSSEYMNQLTTGAPQLSTVTKWINIHDDIKEYLIRVLYSESIRWFRAINANGVVTEKENTKPIQVMERTVFNEGVKIGLNIIDKIVKNKDFNVQCKCDLGNLQYWII